MPTSRTSTHSIPVISRALFHTSQFEKSTGCWKLVKSRAKLNTDLNMNTGLDFLIMKIIIVNDVTTIGVNSNN